MKHENAALQILRFRRKGQPNITVVMHQEANFGRPTSDDRDYDLMLARMLSQTCDYYNFEATGKTALNRLL